MQKVHIIGTGLGYADLSPARLKLIDQAQILVGGKRQLSWFELHPGLKIEIKPPVDDIIRNIQEWMNSRRVVVLTSGDPLFYGIGRRLIRDLGADNVEIHPNMSVMSAAFARIKHSWEDAAWVSLHARPVHTLLPALAGNRPLFVYTDGQNSPVKVAEILEQYCPDRWRMCVLERLGRDDERVRWLDPAEAVGESFLEPNALILQPDFEGRGAAHELNLGTPDEHYVHQEGMITKSEVRAVTLARLGLNPESVFWDLGSGSGAIAVEACLFVTRGMVVAVEKNPDRLAQIRENLLRFQTPHVKVLQLNLPEGMDDLPDPDRVFIGGGGPDLSEIIRISAKRLIPGGRIVLNLVVLETLNRALETIKELGMKPEVVQVQISRGQEMPGGIRLSAGNPVFILSASKKKDK